MQYKLNSKETQLHETTIKDKIDIRHLKYSLGLVYIIQHILLTETSYHMWKLADIYIQKLKKTNNQSTSYRSIYFSQHQSKREREKTFTNHKNKPIHKRVIIVPTITAALEMSKAYAIINIHTLIHSNISNYCINVKGHKAYTAYRNNIYSIKNWRSPRRHPFTHNFQHIQFRHTYSPKQAEFLTYALQQSTYREHKHTYNHIYTPSKIG